MDAIIISGDDEVDLCRRNVLHRYFVLIGLIFVVSGWIVSQYVSISFAWGGYKAQAIGEELFDTSNENKALCVMRQDFLRSLSEQEVVQISWEIADVCVENTPEDTGATRLMNFEQELSALVVGYPIAAMVPAIAKRDRTVAAFLVGIAKKESDWGKHVPTLGGQDCFNYWGYKGSGSRGTGMGYACFSSPEEAIAVVGDRLEHFVRATQRDTPAEMIVWKCGNSCAGHSPESVRSWIGSVDIYFRKIVANTRG